MRDARLGPFPIIAEALGVALGIPSGNEAREIDLQQEARIEDRLPFKIRLEQQPNAKQDIPFTVKCCTAKLLRSTRYHSGDMVGSKLFQNKRYHSR